jgi:hypothetical protein
MWKSNTPLSSTGPRRLSRGDPAVIPDYRQWPQMLVFTCHCRRSAGRRVASKAEPVSSPIPRGHSKPRRPLPFSTAHWRTARSTNARTGEEPGTPTANITLLSTARKPARGEVSTACRREHAAPAQAVDTSKQATLSDPCPVRPDRCVSIFLPADSATCGTAESSLGSPVYTNNTNQFRGGKYDARVRSRTQAAIAGRRE